VANPRGAIILADGDVPSRDALDAAWPRWADGLELVVAADGGARHAAALRLPIDVWVGDGDSVDPALLARLEADGIDVRRVPADKDETDAELALRAALDAGMTRIVILGGLGGPRLDHALANLGLLEHPGLREHLALGDASSAVGDSSSAVADAPSAVAYDARGTRLSVMTGPLARDLDGRDGDLVSLMPLGATAHGVTTTNLRYPLLGEDLELGRTRGISNVRTARTARVELESGRLLVIETPVTVGS
jgi:thiamine pyrophosphokinase